MRFDETLECGAVTGARMRTLTRRSRRRERTPPVLSTALDECMYPCDRHRSVHAKDIEEWRDRWPRSSGRTGGVHVDVLCDDGVEQAMGRGARSQRSSFTEELVHGLVDLSLTPLLCRRNFCAVPSTAARPRLDGMATLSTSAGAVSGGAHRGVRETMAFIARRLGPEKVRLQSRRR